VWLSTQETTILQNEFVRPGDRLVLYSLETVAKLAVSVGYRRFFVPLDHPSVFCHLRDSKATPRSLRQLVSASTKFPLMLELIEHGSYINFSDHVLPSETALKVEVPVC